MSAAAAMLSPVSAVTAGSRRGDLWAPATVDRLASLLDGGASFSAAADALGVTRNACIGRANRSRAAGDPRFALRARVLVALPVPERKPARDSPFFGLKGKQQPVVDAMVADRLLFSPAARAQAFAPTSLRVPIVEAREKACRYIASDPRVNPTTCGHATDGGPYCAYHASLVRQRTT